MVNITEKLEQTIYGYDPNQYLPIYEEGELANRSAFIAYKAKRVMNHAGNVAVKAIEALDSIYQLAQ